LHATQIIWAAWFTILELLVVVGIIVVMLGILIPTITRIRVAEKAIACQANVRTLMQGMLAFAIDNDNRLPGNVGTSGNSVASQRNWLFGSNGGGSSTIMLAPQSGTLFPYVNNNYNVYLCPSLQAFDGAGGSNDNSSADAALNWSSASNGRFDYAIFAVWTGARLQSIAPTAHMTYPDGHFDTLPTPILVQDAPDQVNGPNEEGCHGNIDLISHVHFGGSYYGAVDGSIQFVNESPNSPSGAGCWCWTSRGPQSGKMQTMATSNPPWGFWDSQ
jgi:type II secretory pathway pseudopilin PulG